MPTTSHNLPTHDQLNSLVGWPSTNHDLLLQPSQGVSPQQPSPPYSDASSGQGTSIQSKSTTTPLLSQPTAGSGKSSPKKRSLDSQSASPEMEDQATKRQRNTEAARRYRQRKVDRVTELEEALAAMTKERDDLRLQLARSETEADVLRRMVGKRS